MLCIIWVRKQQDLVYDKEKPRLTDILTTSTFIAGFLYTCGQ